MQFYKQQDPIAKPKLAVPVTVPHHIVLTGLSSKDAKTRAVGDLCCIAFYYLLRVGEYTYEKQRKRTQRFRIKDITFRRADHSIIPNTAPLHDLWQAKFATLRISNQKNGLRGQCIHQECTGLSTSPIKALARRVAHIMANTSSQNTAISTYFPNNDGFPDQIRPADINRAIRHATKALQLDRCGFTDKDVSSHSLRAGGAMAMKLNGVDSITIKKHGRWSSNTFMMYIHEQIGAVMQGISTKMSSYIPFHNTLSQGPTLLEPEDINDIPS